MKEHIGYIIAGNFYKYKAYKVTYQNDLVYYLAEPLGIGATRSAKTMEQLIQVLNQDAKKINCILHKSRTKW